MGEKLRSEWNKLCCKCRCCRSDVQTYGIVLLVAGAVTIGAFLIPCKVWLVILCGIMIFAGYKLFTS